MDALIIERIWEDVDFYEIALNVKGLEINIKMATYVNNEMMIELSEGLNQVGIGKVDEFLWGLEKTLKMLLHMLR